MRPPTLLPVTTAVALVLALAACGAGSSFGTGQALSSNDFRAAVDQIAATGKPAYYLGSSYDDLPLTWLDLVEENAPSFQVQADYGTCESFGDGGCSDPVVVSTNDWRPDVDGLTCQRLDPQLGVPAGVVMGELTLVTGELVITVSDFRERPDGDGIRPAVRALATLRRVGEASPVGSLPPPTPEVAGWMDEVCGTTPGQEVSHELGGGPDALDNSTVPDFTVERLGGGELAWADYRGKPLVLVVGTGPQVSATVQRLKPLIARNASHPPLLGLVSDPTGDKFNPRPVAEIESEVGDLGVPVGYAAVPLSAVWFLDAAANRGNQNAWDEGVVAFVDASGTVSQFARPSAPAAQLGEWSRALG
ncbi:hypothetical protein [Phycicoccus sp. Soil802]|uniref:hypothetical protein n=1 Tax=Phycicoccus sp. Soil802 TaxID=1736414 RepID=UPI0007033C9D|nr:hypothetical protein [Phycicoccus sp. Soil802]KRF22572.1 hypothetical protein ASG91_14125 [Phycicoccus sp. Soil802]